MKLELILSFNVRQYSYVVYVGEQAFLTLFPAGALVAWPVVAVGQKDGLRGKVAGYLPVGEKRFPPIPPETLDRFDAQGCQCCR